MTYGKSLPGAKSVVSKFMIVEMSTMPLKAIPLPMRYPDNAEARVVP